MPAEAKRAREEHAAQLKQPTGRSRRRSELGPERPRPAPAGSTPASCPSPTGSALRANPFPEVTDLICRLPLPTLIYRLEAIHLGDLLRIWVRTRPKVRDGVLGLRQARGQATDRNSAVI